MDWFSWLSKSGLEPSLVYEYGLTFAHNELEEEDMFYFNHEFLQSMGISIAKHRLEILKLARKERGKIPRPMTRLLVAMRKTKRYFANYIRTWVHRDEKALVVVPKPGYGATLRGALLKSNRKPMVKQERLLLTNGSPIVTPGRAAENFSGPFVYDLRKMEKIEPEAEADVDGYWGAGAEEIRWDTLFQNLKPT